MLIGVGMLIHLQVKDFTLVKELSLEFRDGLTALTGETGAGKSILLGALGLALGDRAEADRVRIGATKSEVTASFDLGAVGAAAQWLKVHDFGSEECILRRSVSKEGRSRAYINGHVVTLSQLRELGDLLVDIHSQHEHQSLLKPSIQQGLLDGFGNLEAKVQSLNSVYKSWHSAEKHLTEIEENYHELNARHQLLSYQKEELDQLQLQEGEFEELENKQKQLASAQEIQAACHQLSEVCTENEGSIVEQLTMGLQLLGRLPIKTEGFDQIEAMLNSALIQVDEAASEIRRQSELILADDIELNDLEQRLGAIFDLARKHRCKPKELWQFHQDLSAELEAMPSGDEQCAKLRDELAELRTEYDQLAISLSKARKKAASHLTKSVNAQIGRLAMSHAGFEVSLNSKQEPSPSGAESAEFLISTVPGQPPRPLAKIASGGELSRISLAIQVVTAATSVTPTLVFDEVDVGIGGETGDIVGRMLRELGAASQVLCVTHLAQVASKATHHLKVEKALSKKSASTNIFELHGESKVSEIARMMGGVVNAEQSIAHARLLLED